MARPGLARRTRSPTTRRRDTPPAEGERRAVGGYGNQYRVAARLILEGLNGDLEWIRVADPAAGRVDDIQVATTGRLDASQVKWERAPGAVTWRSLLRDSRRTPSLVRQLADGWQRLRTTDPGRRVVVHLIANGSPSTAKGRLGSLERFLAQAWPHRAEGKAALAPEWAAAWDALLGASGLTPSEFDRFAGSCELELGYSLSRSPFSRDDDALPVGVTDIANLLWQLVASPERIIEVSRADLLDRLGWTDLFRVRHHHDFPVDRRVYQAPQAARLSLDRLLDETPGGYVAVVGPPGSGKSSLLTESLRLRPERKVRYYAFVPGDSTATLRGETLSFLHDTVFRLRRMGYTSRELLRDDPGWLQRELGQQLQLLGKAFEEDDERTILLIDGLDHTTRDPQPERAFLTALPEPTAVPPGVLIVLGTQSTGLPGLSASIRTQVSTPARRLELGPLDSATVDAVIDSWSITPPISPDDRQAIHRVASGHPLTLTYVLRQVTETPAADRASRLASVPAYEGDLQSYYESHWTTLQSDEHVASALLHAARLRGPIDIPWLIDHLDAPGVGTRLVDRAGHYFRRPTPDRWTFFHDSFRQFLAERTATDERAIHRRLARWFESDQASPELLYHRVKAADEAGALQLADFSYFRGQLGGARPPESIARDARLLAGVAAARRDVTLLVRLMFIAAEMANRAFFVDRPYLVRVLADLGEVDAVVAFAEQPSQFGDRERIGLDACLALARAGALEPATRLLDEATSDLLHDKGQFARESTEDAGSWGRASARLLQDTAIGELLAALRAADAGSGYSRVSYFATAAVDELVDIGELARGATLASSLDLEAAGEADARARAYVSLLEAHRLSGSAEAQVSLADHAIQELRGRPLSHESLYRLLYELAAAQLPDVPDIVARLEGPGTLDLRGLEGFRRYRPAMWWTAVRTATGNAVDPDALQAELGQHADARVVRVVHSLGTMLGSAVAAPLDAWAFHDSALRITRSFLFGRGRRPLDDYPLEQAHFGAHDMLIKAATYLGREHLETLFVLYESEWARPHVGWPDELKRRILHAYLRLGGYEGRVHPHLSDLNSRPPQGDVSSRFVTLLDHADSWIALGEPERARHAVVQALGSGFGVGYRKDYQLDFWLPWLERIGQVDPLGMPERLAAIAAPLKELDDLTEGRATELAASSLIQIAAGWQPAAGVTLLRWLLEVGAVTFYGGVLALLGKALERGADATAVATFAGAWTIPLEREAESSFVTALCSQLGATASTRGAEQLLRALQGYSRPSIRPAWAHLMREKLVTAGLLTASDVDELTTSGLLPSPTSDSAGPPDARDPALATIEELTAWLEADRFISREQLRRALPSFLAAADSADICGLANIAAPAAALILAADELRRRGLVRDAQRLAEAALARRNPNGWDRWYDGGTVLDSLALLRRLSPARGRELAFEALRQDLTSGEGNAVWILRSLDELLPHLADGDIVRDVWPSVENYLHALLNVEGAAKRPDLSNLATWSIDVALVDLAGPWIANPVTLIAQLTREAMASLAADGWQPALDGLELQLTSPHAEVAMSALSVLEAAAAQSATAIDALRPYIEQHLRSPMLDARLSACRLLGQPATTVAGVPREAPLPGIYRLSLPPSSGRLTHRRRVPEVGEPVRDTQDVFEIVGAFEDEVRALARSSGIDASTLAHRVIQIAAELGLEQQLGESGETALQSSLKSAYLEYPYVRPRSTAVRLALSHAAAELLDHELLSAADVARLKIRFMWTDGAFDALQPARAPSWLLRPIRDRDAHGPVEAWVREVRSEQRKLPRTSFGVVAVEASTVRSLDWPRPTERRRRTLVPAADAGALAASDNELLGSIVLPLRDYWRASDPDGALVFRNFTMRFQSTKAPWLTINASAAKSLGWRPDATNLCGWMSGDGRPRIRATVWMDGSIEAPSPELYDQPARGAYLEATDDAMDELEEAFGRLLVVESVERLAREDGQDHSAATRRFWDWRAFG